jgi:CheY-like chemotaxis protein
MKMLRNDSPSPPVTSAARRRVLVVDDNRDAADSLGLLLEMEGYDVRTAYDGRQALDLFQAFAPDAVFLDINMPEIDGCTVAEMIRTQQAGRPAARVAAISASSCPGKCRVSGQACHFDKHFGKPCDLDKVLAFLSLPKPALLAT